MLKEETFTFSPNKFKILTHIAVSRICTNYIPPNLLQTFITKVSFFLVDSLTLEAI